MKVGADYVPYLESVSSQCRDSAAVKRLLVNVVAPESYSNNARSSNGSPLPDLDPAVGGSSAPVPPGQPSISPSPNLDGGLDGVGIRDPDHGGADLISLVEFVDDIATSVADDDGSIIRALEVGLNGYDDAAMQDANVFHRVQLEDPIDEIELNNDTSYMTKLHLTLHTSAMPNKCIGCRGAEHAKTPSRCRSISGIAVHI